MDADRSHRVDREERFERAQLARPHLGLDVSRHIGLEDRRLDERSEHVAAFAAKIQQIEVDAQSDTTEVKRRRPLILV
jgi:hypothetical protein